MTALDGHPVGMAVVRQPVPQNRVPRSAGGTAVHTLFRRPGRSGRIAPILRQNGGAIQPGTENHAIPVSEAGGHRTADRSEYAVSRFQSPVPADDRRGNAAMPARRDLRLQSRWRTIYEMHFSKKRIIHEHRTLSNLLGRRAVARPAAAGSVGRPGRRRPTGQTHPEKKTAASRG